MNNQCVLLYNKRLYTLIDNAECRNMYRKKQEAKESLRILYVCILRCTWFRFWKSNWFILPKMDATSSNGVNAIADCTVHAHQVL